MITRKIKIQDNEYEIQFDERSHALRVQSLIPHTIALIDNSTTTPTVITLDKAAFDKGEYKELSKVQQTLQGTI